MDGTDWRAPVEGSQWWDEPPESTFDDVLDKLQNEPHDYYVDIVRIDLCVPHCKYLEVVNYWKNKYECIAAGTETFWALNNCTNSAAASYGYGNALVNPETWFEYLLKERHQCGDKKTKGKLAKVTIVRPSTLATEKSAEWREGHGYER